MEGMAAENPLYRHEAALAKAVLLHRSVGIFRTTGYITATGGKMGRNGALVKTNQRQRCLSYEYHRLISALHEAGQGKKPVKLL
jgi:hypothetical protein